jgi:hypothetical protein
LYFSCLLKLVTAHTTVLRSDCVNLLHLCIGRATCNILGVLKVALSRWCTVQLIIFTCTEILFVTVGNSVVTLALVSTVILLVHLLNLHLVVNKVVFLQNMSKVLVNQLLGYPI